MDLITLMCGTKYLQYDKSKIDAVAIDAFVLTYNQTYVEQWEADAQVLSYFGLISTLDYRNNPYFISRNTREELFKWFSASSLNGVMELSHLHLDSVISSLWFVKDNSVNLSVLYGRDPELDGALTKLQLQCYSNCKGQYENVVFELSEIEKAFQFSKELDHLSKFHTVNAEDFRDSDGHGVIAPAALNSKTYNNHNRIARAYLFLNMARSKSFLPLKISFYIAVYESLFTTDGSEVSHKVTERAVLFIGGRQDEKMANFKTLKKAYGVRSKYLHGQELSKGTNNIAELSKLSEKIDSLTRTLFLRIVASDGGHFLKNDNDLNDWFTEMLVGI
jgi:hypothetical protein